MSYKITFEDEQKEFDKVFKSHGITIFCDVKSWIYVRGCEIDLPGAPDALDLCHALMRRGLLAKPTHGNIIRFAPPLVLTAAQMDECLDIIRTTFLNFRKS